MRSDEYKKLHSAQHRIEEVLEAHQRVLEELVLLIENHNTILLEERDSDQEPAPQDTQAEEVNEEPSSSTTE